jgi:hypothetical protein
MQRFRRMAPPSNSRPPRRRRLRTVRLAGLQATLLAAAALTLGLTSSELARRQRQEPISSIAAERGIDLAQLRSVALTAAEPLLDEAVRNGALSEHERDSLRWQIRARISSV